MSDVQEKIEEHIAGYSDWRGVLLTRLRKLINQSEPELKEDFKWSVPVWTGNGMVCAISGFKDHVKMNFFKGSQLNDHNNIINGGLASKDHRSVNFAENSQVDEKAIRDLLHQAVKIDSK